MGTFVLEPTATTPLLWTLGLTLGFTLMGLFARNRRKSFDLTHLSEIGRALGTPLPFDDLLRLVYSQVRSTFDVSTLSLARYGDTVS